MSDAGDELRARLYQQHSSSAGPASGSHSSVQRGRLVPRRQPASSTAPRAKRKAPADGMAKDSLGPRKLRGLPARAMPASILSSASSPAITEARAQKMEQGGVLKAGATLSPSASSDEGQGAGGAAPPPTFLESLDLDASHLREFDAGNFLYLRPTCATATAYDLEACEHHEVDETRYYTLSSAGVTSFAGSDSQFTSFERWEREFRCFHLIRRLPFFAKYRRWKSFLEWKRVVRGKKMGGSKQVLENTSFLFVPKLCETMLQVRTLCMTVYNLQLIVVDPERSYSLDEFCAVQQEAQQDMMVQLRKFSDAVRVLSVEACEELVDTFLSEARVVADVKMTFMEKASLRRHCQMLCRFLRLVDFVVEDTLRDLAIDGAQRFIDVLTNPSAPTEPVVHIDDEWRGSAQGASSPSAWNMADPTATGSGRPFTPTFTTEFAFAPEVDEDTGEHETLIVPDNDVFRRRLDHVIMAAIDALGVPEPVLTHHDLEPFTGVSAGDSPSQDDEESKVPIQVQVAQDPHFLSRVDKIYTAVFDNLNHVLDWAKIFDPYKTLYFQNEAYVHDVVELYTDAPLDDFRAAVTKYNDQCKNFEGIPHSATIGVVCADASQLRKRLLPSPVQCLVALRELLPKMMRDASKALLQDLQAIVPIASSNPADVDGFIEKCKVCDQGGKDLASYRQRLARVDAMAHLTIEEGWQLADDLKANQTMAADDLATLDNSIEIAAGKREEDTAKFSKMIEDDVSKTNKEVNAVREKLGDARINDKDASTQEVITFLEDCGDELQKLREHSDTLNDYESVLKMPNTEFETLHEVCGDHALKLRLWQGVRDWADLANGWNATEFHHIHPEDMERQVAVFNKTAYQGTKGIPGTTVGPMLQDRVEVFKPLVPIVVDLCNKALKQRHWDEIHEKVGFQIDGVENMTLGRLTELCIQQHTEEISQVAVSAQQEQVLEEMMDKVKGLWVECDFELNPYKEAKDMWILGAVDEIITNLDDSLVSINTILGSRFVGAIRDEVERWQHKLLLCQETLDEWLMVQKNWMYLETIFSAPDIQRQLPEASSKFFSVDKSFRGIMKSTNDNPNALKAATVSGLRDTLRKHNTDLDKIQKNLEDYLETKRASFPRFYFLSNDELLEILAQTKNVQAVQPHLRKCFDAIQSLDFGRDPKSVDIFAMFSPEGERVELTKNLKARGNVEDWLTNVETSMRTALHKLMKAGVMDFDTKLRKDWVFDHAGQIVATGAQITWARGTEEPLLGDNPIEDMKTWYQTNLDDIQDLIAHIRSKLPKIHRKVIVALITTDVHGRDIVQGLVQEKVDDDRNFDWRKCLRYYWDPVEDDVVIKHSDANLRYGYEYQGPTSRLVITPLTDRCWMTLTGAYKLKLGGAPAGPAGTGKTESTKDLAKAMGIFCIVFNCGEQVDYKMMGKLFRGLAQSGGWTCLDEFNRIDIEVLSVVAQQMLSLREGRLAGKSHIDFLGIRIKLMDHHVIITMNPGYAGRTELPDNLQVCFRGVAMLVPDYALIAEIMLFAEGFGEAFPLSKKMCKLYILMSEQLSQQRHYDYGLRAVKSVLVIAGALKRNNPDKEENDLLIRAICDANLPKFLAFDLPLFRGLVQDLFPGTEIKEHDLGRFGAVMLDEIDKMGFLPTKVFVGKINELFGIMQIRFGTSLVGPTGGGKTAAWQVLAHTMTTLRQEDDANEAFQIVRYEILNPKCIAMGELYGEFNELTQEWKDGLAPTILRRQVAEETIDRRWTCFDGPIDALWIESMNTVLDDNMMLCLANGERIKLKVEMKMLFEVMDVDEASPATVSRLGIVYVAPETIGWEAYTKRWLYGTEKAPTEVMAHVPDATRDHIMSLFQAYFPSVIGFVRKRCKEYIETVDIQQATACSALFQSLFQEANGISMAAEPSKLNQLASQLWAFSFIWSIGVSLTAQGWEMFEEFVRDMWSEAAFKVGIPGGGSIFDYYVKIEDGVGTFTKWDEIVPTYVADPSRSYFDIMVETVDTTRFGFVAESLLSIAKPMFFTGVTGTGKTVVIEKLLERLKPLPDEGGQGIEPIFVNYSAQTDSLVAQNYIESSMVKQKKTLLGAPAGRKIVIFVDDVNMPFVQEYGAQAPIELLRQLMAQGGFYDRDKLFWKDFQDHNLMVASAPPGGGRNKVTPRFSRYFSVLCMQQASNSILETIFSSILGGYFEKGFVTEVQQMVLPLVKGAIEVYNRIAQELLPTPAKSHYTFNLRDISKVFQGMLMVKAGKCGTKEKVAKLWMHEEMRVFCDRLVDRTDQRWFTDLLVELNSRFNIGNWSHDELFENDKHPLLWTDIMKAGVDAEDRQYEEVPEAAKLMSILDDWLDEYNMDHSTQMNLVFFLDATKHIARLLRVLRQPRGNAMLIGVGGSGKQSTCRLAAAISEQSCFSIELVRGYNLQSFRDDVKELMIKTGVKGERVAFLFTDTQVVSDDFLEDINNVLNTGEVPNIFPADELERIIGDMRDVCKSLGVIDTRANCWKTFISRVRENLHIVLAMSPVGDNLRVWCRQFPSLINCTTIDYYLSWPRAALEAVATTKLASLELENNDDRPKLVDMCTQVHMSVGEVADDFWEVMRRKVYTTPKSYLDLIALYLEMLAQRREIVNADRDRMSIGVQKLDETNEIVADLQVDLEKLKPVLKVKSAEAAEMLTRVRKDQADADIVKARVEKDAKVVEKQAEEAGAVAADAQADLDKALPAFKSAVKALDSLTKADITEVKGFTKPPPAVQMVMEAVCTLLKEKTDWDTAKKVMSNMQFMDTLKEYDKDNIPENILKKVRKYTALPEMEVEAVGRVSKAAKSLCMWVHAMDVYAAVAKEVGPKKEKLDKMNAILKDAQDSLAAKQADLQAILDKVADLQRQCDETIAEKDRLADEAALTEARLVRAEKLTGGLADEGVRWRATLAHLNEAVKQLVGDVFLCAGFISYIGAFTGVYRDKLLSSWLEKMRDKEMPCSETPTLVDTMGDPVEIRDWQLHSLPSDPVSVDNAILVTRGKRWPLCIDPQGQAHAWILNMEEQHNMEVTTMSDQNMLRSVENCIRVGKPLLFEDVGEQLDPSIEPVLARATFKQGGRLLIHLGDSDIDYDPNFRFYMTTRMPNPHYLPEVCIKVTVINFTVTLTGLQDQLLADVVNNERPDVEERKVSLMLSIAADKKKLSDIQAEILRSLSASEGNILDDAELIDTLGVAKVTAAAIDESVAEAEVTMAEISETRLQYVPVAKRGAIIYFVVADLAQIDPMYQYSLEYYAGLFRRIMRDATPCDDLEKRLQILLDAVTLIMYQNVCRGLFNKDRSLYSSLICGMILRDAGDILDSEWNTLLRGAGTVDREVQEPNPDPARINEFDWDCLWAAQDRICTGTDEEGNPIYPFEGLQKSLCDEYDVWLKWIDSEDPLHEPLPCGYQETVGDFQKLILIKVFRGEKMINSMLDYVAHHLGKPFAESPQANMQDIYDDLDNKTPCIFVLSSGADPTGMLLRFAKAKNYADRLGVISLGQGQGPRASQMIKQGCKTGDWACLQNCMLAKSWMNDLEHIVHGLQKDSESNHEDFRLFLTSMPVAFFPVFVLQNGVKMTNEPPRGLRANIGNTFKNLIDQDRFEMFANNEKKTREWKKLAFGLCFFSALVQERRKFGALGWNVRYGFDESDVQTSLDVLERFVTEQDDVPWDALVYVTGHINFGGRVTDDWDRRCLIDILEIPCCPPVLTDEYRFSASGLYYSPAVGTYQEMQAFIQGLPEEEDPEIFGMHENANTTYNKNLGATLIKDMLSLQPRATGGGGAGLSSDDIVTNTAQAIFEDMPAQLDLDDAGETTFVVQANGLLTSLMIVLQQEIVKFNKLLGVLSSSLVQIQKAIKGLVLMSIDLDAMYTACLNNAVPPIWEKVSFASLKTLGSWVKDLVFRVGFMKNWLVNGQPASFPLNLFFFPQGFMTGTMQTYARKYKVPVNKLDFKFSVLDAEITADTVEEPDDGVICNGLYLEAARWDPEKCVLVDSRVGELYTEFPFVHFLPELNHVRDENEYQCPTYKTSVRKGALSTTGMSTNYVVAIELPTEKKPTAWTLCGTAFLLNLDD